MAETSVFLLDGILRLDRVAGITDDALNWFTGRFADAWPKVAGR